MSLPFLRKNEETLDRVLVSHYDKDTDELFRLGLRSQVVGLREQSRRLNHFWGSNVDTFVYIDGFNFYYGAVKDTAYKWLDFKKLVSNKLLQIGPRCNRCKTKFLTAYISHY